MKSISQRLDRLEARYGAADEEMVTTDVPEHVKAHVRALLAARGVPPEQIEHEVAPEAVPRRYAWSEIPATLRERIKAATGSTLVTAAWAAVRVKRSYLQAQFLRLKARRGAKKAILAVAASMLTAIYVMLRDHVPYRDLGPQHFDERQRTRTIRRLLRRLHDLGCPVTTTSQIDPSTAIASAS